MRKIGGSGVKLSDHRLGLTRVQLGHNHAHELSLLPLECIPKSSFTLSHPCRWLRSPSADLTKFAGARCEILRGVSLCIERCLLQGSDKFKTLVSKTLLYLLAKLVRQKNGAASGK